MTNIEETDATTVAAVRNGECDRYRDLVERYERQVYCVAWARLGNADLAEEATQEAFIKAYRSLSLLAKAERFGSWVCAIARNVAINLGLRRRHELQKRERWALLQAPELAPGGEPRSEELISNQTLSGVLGDLPPLHREALVLFYLEGKSIAEAATALGITETAFKTRLHRARAVLRDRVQEELEEALGQVRPTKSVAPAVMLFLSNSTVEFAAVGGGGAGLLAKLGGLGAKLVPFQFLMGGLFLLGVIPAYLLAVAEQRMYRDQAGFRAKLFGCGDQAGADLSRCSMAVAFLP
jgi:RNA polymerase sigma factor (sigma-70 family)